MNYHSFTPAKIQIRFSEIPDDIRDALLSDQTATTLNHIIQTHFLDEDKALVLKQLVVLVLLGFVSPDDLNFEMVEQMFLNHAHANALAKELNNQIFHPLKEELEKIYNPLSKEDTQEDTDVEELEPSEDVENSEEKTITFAGIEGGAFGSEESVPVHVSDTPIEENKEDNPFVLQEERPVETTGGAGGGKKFSLSLGGFFKPKKKEGSASQEPVRAKIDLFSGGKDEKKVIHYSELRTPLDAREQDIFKQREEQPIGSVGQISQVDQISPIEPISSVEKISPVDSTNPAGKVEQLEKTEPSPAPTENLSPSPLTSPPAKKSPWAFKWFGSQAPARDEQKTVPESVVINDTSFRENIEEKEEARKERVEDGAIGQIGPIGPVNPIEPIDPISPINSIESINPIEPIRPINPIEPIEQIEQNNEPKNPTIEGNIVDLSKLKK